MSLLARIFGQPGVPEHNYVESALAFPELDVERLARRLRVSEDGLARGFTDDPPPDNDTFDVVEARITSELEREARSAYDRHAAHSTAYADRVSSLGIANLIATLGASAQSVRADFEAEVQRGRDVLHQLAEAVTETRRELLAFQRTHGLARRSRHPTSRLKHWGLAAILVFLEAPLNGTFLAAGHAFGLVGGISQAFVIAVINVAMGLFLGRLILPNVAHRSSWRRVSGVVGTILVASLTVAFNLAVAHYRAALQAPDPSAAERVAVRTFLSSPLAIEEVSGWLLLVVGVAFAAIAASDGWAMDDPYPGYGAATRRYEDAYDDYITEKSDRSTALEDIRRASIERLDAMGQDLATKAGQHRSLKQRQVALHERFEQHLTHHEQCGNDLLSRYRAANRGARKTTPPPHFALAWRIPRPSPLIRSESIDEPSIDREAAAAIASLRRVREDVDGAFQAALREYRAIDDLVAAAKPHGVNSSSPTTKA